MKIFFRQATLYVSILLTVSSVKAQKVQATVASGAHLIQTTDWTRFNNNIISAENLDGSNKHFYYDLSRNYNPNAMYVTGLGNDFPQNTAVYVYVIKPSIKVISAGPSTIATVNSGAHLIAPFDWLPYSSSKILVEELDGRNQHIYTTSGARPYNANAMYVTGMEADFIQLTAVRVYNLDEAIFIQDGKLSFSSTGNLEKLSVNGKIRAKEIKVEAAPWPDYVFNTTYKLPDLKATEQFIKANKHLPEIPSAAEVEKEGVNLGEMNAKLLKKIEELTLHLIEQNKELIDAKSKIQILTNRMDALSSSQKKNP